MTTALQYHMKEIRLNQPDPLLDNIKVNLSTEQMNYLALNKEMGRSLLYKLFKRKFNSNINKLQFNATLEEVRGESVERKSKPQSVLASYPRPNVPKEKNVYWMAQQGVWAVKFKKDGKTTNVGRYSEISRAVKVAEEYRQNLA